MNLGGEADRPLVDVESKEAERRVEVPPVQRDVLPGDEPVVDVEAQAGVGTGADALDVGNADEAVEIGDRVRLAGPGGNMWNTSGLAGASGWMPPGIGRGSPARRAASAGPAPATWVPRNPAAPSPAPATRNWRRLGVCR